MASFNYHHLRYFWPIAHEGSLTGARRAAKPVPVGALGQLAKLEYQLGHLLFKRAGKRLVLTEAGRIAQDYAGTVFQAGDELVSTMQGRPLDRARSCASGR